MTNNKNFVNKRSELTKVIEGVTIAGLEVYRVRTVCNCAAPSNRRDGVIVSDSDIIIAKVIRCKDCKKGGMIWKNR